jgi:hypothetical protein
MIRILTILFLCVTFSNVLIAQPGSPPEEAPSDLEITWIEPSSSLSRVPKHERMELGITIPQEQLTRIDKFVSGKPNGLNPYDPAQVDLRVRLTSPSGKKITRFAFYFKRFTHVIEGNGGDLANYRNEYVPIQTIDPFHFRFAPDETGEWRLGIELWVDGKLSTKLKDDVSFTCISGNHKGYLTIGNGESEADRWMYYSETGEPFYAISENLASAGECGYYPSQNKRHLAALDKFIAEGGNFARFELGAQAGLPDWPSHNNYSDKLDEMQAFDRIVDKCEDNGVYFILFRHHVEVMMREEWADIRWQNNPYRKALGLKSVEEYFTTKEAIKWQRNCLRYIYSRWGYSPNMAFFSYSEVDNWYYQMAKDAADDKITAESGVMKNPGKDSEAYAAARLRIWINDHQDYIKKELNEKARFCHTYASVGKMEESNATSFFTLSDIVGLHSYGDMKDINFKRRYDLLEFYWKKYRKPVFIEEMGPERVAMFCCTGIEFHNSVWSTAFMGGFGTGMDWWWDRGVFDFDYQKDLGLITQFFEGIDVRKGQYSPQKWQDANVSKRKIENFTLVSSNKESAMGWVHNATYYWRNLWDENPCVRNILEGKTSDNQPCYYARDEHGHPFQKYGTPCPWNHVDVYVHENLSGFDKKEFKDKYTDEAGSVPIVRHEKGRTPTFEISGLLGAASPKKHWYRVEFFSTHTNELKHMKSLDRVIHTSAGGDLDIEVPNLDSATPDYAYKVVYIGRSTKARMKKKLKNPALN